VSRSPVLGRVVYTESVEIAERATEQVLTLTPVAAAKIKQLMAEEPEGEATVLRVAIQGGGCSGFVLEGVPVVVDPFSAPYLRGAQIDFLTGLQESGFKIDNPNAVAACGCGHSFQVEEGTESSEADAYAGPGCGSGCSH
jgi:Fe-S cluster assembly iron-binding protein IscA